MTLYWWY